MIEVTIFLGKSFDQGQEWDTYSFPAVPRIGDLIRQPEGPRQIVKETEFFLGSDGTAQVRILVDSEHKRSAYSVDAMIG